MSASADGTAYRVGVDIGGTFTDVVVASGDGRISVQKRLSTPKDYSVAVVEGVLAGLADLGLDASRKSEIVHATTVATNTIVEGTGARCALITTRGFRDVLEIGRLRFSTLYDFRYEKPKPLVPRRHVFEAAERIDAKGSVCVGLAPDEIDRVVDAVAGSGCEAVAISLLNAFANPAHEQLLAQAVRRRLPGVDLSVSSQILPQIGEYERTSTTAINAYIMPKVRHYLTSLVDRLRGSAVRGALLVMRSGGGIMGVERAIREPVHMVESGPVAGVLASRRILGWAGLDDLLTVDVGGTTAKASIVEDGRFLRTIDYEVGGSVAATTRLAGGGGYPIQVPVIDIAEVGAGGGSIVWVDSGGSPRVGPQSAGAAPGPVCYGRGGEHVTLTDANLILGYLNQDRLAGGVALQRSLAERAMRERVAEPLGLGLEAAAYGVFRIANAQMMGAIRAVSTQRGRDVRGYALAAFGGNGPVHAAELARAIGISTVVIPPSPGVFSATGLLVTDLEYDATKVLYGNHSELEPAALNQVLGELRDRIEALFREEHMAASPLELEAAFDMRYWGQNADLTVTVPFAPFDVGALVSLKEAFEIEHERTYGHRAVNEEVVLVLVRVIGRARPALAADGARSLEGLVSRGAARASNRSRRAYFGPEQGYVSCPVIGRGELSRVPRPGPLLIEEYDSVAVVPPGSKARLDGFGNIVLEVGRGN